MKKTVIAAVLCTAAAFASSLTAMAGTSDISVKNNSPQSKPVSYSYDAESDAEVSKSIKSLMTKLDELERQDSVVQTLTVTSKSDGGAPVNVKLRLSLPSAETGDGPSSPIAYDAEALGYYDLKVTSSDGTVLYDGKDAPETYENIGYRDINLGTVNETSDAENKIFNVTISVNKDMKKYANTAEKLDWSIVTSAGGVSPTPPPETENAADTEQSENDAPSAQVTAAPTSVPSATPLSENPVINAGNYVVGHDIPAGRYTMTGSGKVHVYTDEGILRMTIAMKYKGDNSANGVDEYVLTVKDGETVGVENEIMLSPFRSSVILPSASPSPSPSAAPKSGANSTSSPAQKNVSSQNPKTGDTTPVALVSVIGAAALLAAAAIAVIKRKIRK